MCRPFQDWFFSNCLSLQNVYWLRKSTYLKHCIEIHVFTQLIWYLHKPVLRYTPSMLIKSQTRICIRNGFNFIFCNHFTTTLPTLGWSTFVLALWFDTIVTKVYLCNIIFSYRISIFSSPSLLHWNILLLSVFIIAVTL